MTYLSRVGQDVDGLISSITGLSQQENPIELKKCRDHAVKAFRSGQYGRTDQFDVRNKMDGLDEKFRVLDRDDLADAIDVRRRELSQFEDKWMPEILSLLLQLSDRPVEKSDVADLEKLRPPEPPPTLTWKEILEDDPYDDPDLWKDIDYAAASSDEESSISEVQPMPATVEPQPAAEEEAPMTIPESFFTKPDYSKLQEILDAQWWRTKEYHESTSSPTSTKLDLTELQIIREVLFMLLGVRTSLFERDMKTATYTLMKNVGIKHLRPDTLRDLLNEYAKIGGDLLRIRRWPESPQTIPVLQSFQDSVGKRLWEFDRVISAIEERLLLQKQVVVSLLGIFAEVERAAEPLRKFVEFFNTVVSNDPEPFEFLEGLYNRMSHAQLLGDEGYFKLLARVFFDSLKTYLVPIREWMQLGQLDEYDGGVFFVGVADTNCEGPSMWRDQFIFKRDATDNLLAPTFLLPYVPKILITGKSVAFLARMGYEPEFLLPPAEESPLDYHSVCEVRQDDGEASRLSKEQQEMMYQLVPFEDRFDEAFKRWMASKYNAASSILRDKLFSLKDHGRRGLWHTLEAFEYIYFSKDGYVFQNFADGIFAKLDGRYKGTWNDRYLLTELSQETFGALTQVDAYRLRTRTFNCKINERSVEALRCVVVDYHIHWAIETIVPRPAIKTYQRIFTLLQQIYRVSYLLQRQNLRSLASSAATTSASPSPFLLRHRFLYLTTTLQAHFTTAVLAPATAGLRKALTDARDLDAMIAAHERFVEGLLQKCLLHDRLRPILDAVLGLLNVGVQFADTWREAIEPEKQKRVEMKAGPGPWGQRPDEWKKGRRRRLADVGVGAGDESSSDDDGDEDEDEEETDGEDEEDQESKGDDEMGDANDRETRTATEKKRAGTDAEEVKQLASLSVRVAQMNGEFDRQLGFLVAGLRGVSRAGGESTWEMLAEKLDPGVTHWD